MPEVSIVIPAFNRANLIAETLDSVIGQSFANWECLIIDDRSSDETPQIAKLYCKKDPRFRYFVNSGSKGAQGSRNMGLDLSGGEFVIFLDSDDLLASFCLQNRVDFARQNPGQDFYCFPTLLFHQHPFDTDTMWNYLNATQNDVVRFFNVDIPWQTTGVMWQKNTFSKIGNWDEALPCWQDWDMHLRAALSPGIQYVKVENHQIDNFYRKDNFSAAISKREKSLESIQAKIFLIEKFYNILSDLGLLQKYKVHFSRFMFRILKEYQKIDQQESLHLLNKYLVSLDYSSNYIRSWKTYFKFRRNMKVFGLFRKLLDIVPNAYRSSSLLSEKTTYQTAKFEEINK